MKKYYHIEANNLDKATSKISDAMLVSRGLFYNIKNEDYDKDEILGLIERLTLNLEIAYENLK